MNKLDWGTVTPESTNLDKNVFTYVFNHRLSSPEEVDRTVRFIVGRLLFYEKHLPANPKHSVKIDARGQNVDQSIKALIAQRIRELYNKPNLQEIEIVE